MACVTLKRPLDLDPLEALHSPNRPTPSKRRRCTPLKSVDRDSNSSNSQQQPSPSFAPSAGPSVFKESPLSHSDIASSLRDELKRLRKRRQLVVEPYPCSSRSPPPLSPGSPEPMMSEAVEAARSLSLVHPGQFSPCRSPPHNSAGISASMMAASPNSKSGSLRSDRPVFTLKQMTMICEKMCRDRTDKVREQYDQILQQKLSEQYDAFVKFIDHQIQQRFSQAQLPSYLS